VLLFWILRHKETVDILDGGLSCCGMFFFGMVMLYKCFIPFFWGVCWCLFPSFWPFVSVLKDLVGSNEGEAPNRTYLQFGYAIRNFWASFSINSLGIVGIFTWKIFSLPISYVFVRPLDFKPSITITITSALLPSIAKSGHYSFYWINCKNFWCSSIHLPLLNYYVLLSVIGTIKRHHLGRLRSPIMR